MQVNEQTRSIYDSLVKVSQLAHIRHFSGGECQDFILSYDDVMQKGLMVRAMAKHCPDTEAVEKSLRAVETDAALLVHYASRGIFTEYAIDTVAQAKDHLTTAIRCMIKAGNLPERHTRH